jgi:hypothetical protein
MGVSSRVESESDWHQVERSTKAFWGGTDTRGNAEGCRGTATAFKEFSFILSLFTNLGNTHDCISARGD